jgi:hypothetical protein
MSSISPESQKLTGGAGETFRQHRPIAKMEFHIFFHSYYLARN